MEQLTANNSPSGITHIWPRNKFINPDAKPFSDEREADVYDEIRDLTFDDDVRGSIYIAPHDFIWKDWTPGTFTGNLSQDDFVVSRVKTLTHREVEYEVHRPATENITLRSQNCGTGEIRETVVPAKPERDEVIKKNIPWNLGSRQDANNIIKEYRAGELSALVLWYPNDSEHLTYVPMVRDACPDLPIYIFHCWHRDDRWGIEREAGSRNWEDEIIPLADCNVEPQEIVVNDLLIKGNIHVIAGRFETYKTMALLEWSSAILDERPVHDHFKVNRRYPIVYMCADMSPEQLAEYAGLFNLQKHGTDFRVRKPKGDIIHAVDSPVIQQAVNGRILVLDTMLDFANIKEAFQSSEWITFFKKLRTLIDVHGCVAVVMTAHATKTGAKANNIDPSEYLKDSVTFGGKIDVGYGFRKVENTSQILIERIKGRGFKKPLSFTITVNDDNGVSYLDRGCFPVCQRPGEVTIKSQIGRPIDPDKQRKIEYARSVEGSLQDRASAVNAKFGSKHSKSTVSEWLKEFDSDTVSG
jgi:hypothetical protein